MVSIFRSDFPVTAMTGILFCRLLIPPLKIRYFPEELKKIVPMVPGNTVQVGEHFYMQIFKNKEN